MNLVNREVSKQRLSYEIRRNQRHSHKSIKVKDLIAKKQEIVEETDGVSNVYDICELQGYLTRDYPTLPTFKEVLNQQANGFNIIL